ncbi:MAG: sugar phosphate isomerase/epimerase [Saprospiraceae bacterium]|nr:sugar phosphate isomerase/epimerase [Saprospiraceae bacterium]
MMNRRKFLKRSGAGAVLINTRPASTILDSSSVITRSSNIKISCNLYSFNQLLTQGIMTLEEVIDFCGNLGFAAVDPTGYYFPDYPQIPSDEYIYAIKRRAFINGMAISGTGIRNDFAQPDADARRADIELAKRWIEVAAKLDAPVLRVFAGKALPEGIDRAEVHGWIIDAVKECLHYGKKHGVMITLQNHNDVLKSATDVKSVLDQLQDDWFGLNLDIGSLRLGDPYEEIELLAPYARTWQIKEHVYRNGIKEALQPTQIAQILKESGYRGYIPLETLQPSDPRERLADFKDEIAAAIQ